MRNKRVHIAILAVLALFAIEIWTAPYRQTPEGKPSATPSSIASPTRRTSPVAELPSKLQPLDLCQNAEKNLDKLVRAFTEGGGRKFTTEVLWENFHRQGKDGKIFRIHKATDENANGVVHAVTKLFSEDADGYPDFVRNLTPLEADKLMAESKAIYNQKTERWHLERDPSAEILVESEGDKIVRFDFNQGDHRIECRDAQLPPCRCL